MTPREVETLTTVEYRAFVDYQNALAREERKAAARADRRGGR